MLYNEMYIGNMVQGKYENRSYKSKHSKPVPKERWIKVEGTHEPIIDMPLWNRVQEMLKERAKPMCSGQLGIYAGKTRCMYCGYNLSSHKSKEYYYLRCTSKFFNDSSCKGAFISQRLLNKVVLQELNEIISRFFDSETALPKITLSRNIDLKKKSIQREIKQCSNKISDLQKAVRNTYVDKAKGIITEEEYFSFRDGFQADIQICQNKIRELNQQFESLDQEYQARRSMTEVLQEYRDVQKLDRAIMDKLIDYIEIGKLEHKQHKDEVPPIIIHWKF